MLVNPKKKEKKNYTNKFNANMLQLVSKSNSNTQNSNQGNNQSIPTVTCPIQQQTSTNKSTQSCLNKGSECREEKIRKSNQINPWLKPYLENFGGGTRALTWWSEGR